MWWGEVLGRPEQWGPSEQGLRAAKCLQSSGPPHSCLGVGSLKGASQRRASRWKHGPLGSAAEATGTAVTPVPTTVPMMVRVGGESWTWQDLAQAFTQPLGWGVALTWQ